jgi:hypothetical protein
MSINWNNLEASIVVDKKLVGSYRLLLQPIERRVPLELFETWRKQLCEAQRTMGKGNAPLDPEVRVSVERIANNLLTALHKQSGSERVDLGPANAWGSAVALLTLSTLIGRIGGTFDPTALDSIWPRTSQNVPEALSEILVQLYHGEARNKPAGPLALYELAQVAILNQGLFFHVAGKPFGNYLGLVKVLHDQKEKPSADKQIPVIPAHSPDDRCMQFLIRRIQVAPDSARPSVATPSYPAALRKYIEGQTRTRFTLKGRKKETLDKIRILLLGESRAGKSTIVKQLYRAISQGTDVGIIQPNMLKTGWEGDRPGYADQTILPIVLLEAKYAIKGGQRPVPCEIIDHRGGILSEPRATVRVEDLQTLADQTGDCDLVIVVLPADQFDANSDHRNFNNLLVTYADFVGRILEKNPFCMIAIVYSKCDEYGLDISRHVRIIDSDTTSPTAPVFDAFARFRRASDDKVAAERWSAFVALASSASAGGPTSKEVADLRRFLLNYTVSLWKQITKLDKKENTLINGYLVAALPAEKMDDELVPEDYVKDVPYEDVFERGFLQIFSDFAAYMQSVWSGR